MEYGNWFEIHRIIDNHTQQYCSAFRYRYDSPAASDFIPYSG